MENKEKMKESKEEKTISEFESRKDDTSEFEDNYKRLINCPYCEARVVKRGIRKKKYEEVQIYYCKNCDKRFTSVLTKNKTYPLRIIIDCLSLYNQLYSYDKIIKKLEGRYGMRITRQIISRWLKEYENYIPFLRMRESVNSKYSENKKEFIEESKLFHKQIYNFKYHRAKLDFIFNEEFWARKFMPLKELLELVIAECPHQIFEDSKRSSEFKDRKNMVFNMNEVKIISKNNMASKLAGFVMQAVSNNKLRHEKLQEFMLYNDSCTIAVELPVLIDCQDLRHYKHELGFEIPLDINLEEGEYITGHIDIMQLRNGLIHIIDFKPSASKEKPIAQLVLYALALSRLTGLRLYNFKCAWFDDKNYYEFFPLHVVYKLRKKRKRIDREQKRLDLEFTIPREQIKRREVICN